MTPSEMVKNLRILEGGKGLEADHQEVNVGIDQSSYDDFCAHRGVPTKPVWSLSQDEIQNFYTVEYIAPLLCTHMPDMIGFILFEYELNVAGAGNKGRAVRDLQLLVGVTPDSVMGPETLKAVLACPDIKKLAIMLLSKQDSWYEELWKKNPEDPIEGWESRISKTREIVGLPIK